MPTASKIRNFLMSKLNNFFFLANLLEITFFLHLLQKILGKNSCFIIMKFISKSITISQIFNFIYQTVGNEFEKNVIRFRWFLVFFWRSLKSIKDKTWTTFFVILNIFKSFCPFFWPLLRVAGQWQPLLLSRKIPTFSIISWVLD